MWPIGIADILEHSEPLGLSLNASGLDLYHVGQGCKPNHAGEDSVTLVPSHRDLGSSRLCISKHVLKGCKLFRVQPKENEGQMTA